SHGGGQPAGLVRLPRERRRPASDALDASHAQLRGGGRSLPPWAMAPTVGAVERALPADTSRRRAPRADRGPAGNDAGLHRPAGRPSSCGAPRTVASRSHAPGRAAARAARRALSPLATRAAGGAADARPRGHRPGTLGRSAGAGGRGTARLEPAHLLGASE